MVELDEDDWHYLAIMQNNPLRTEYSRSNLQRLTSQTRSGSVEAALELATTAWDIVDPIMTDLNLESYRIPRKLVQYAADSGNAKALWILGKMYKDGVGVETSRDIAIRYFRESAMQDFPDAAYDLVYACMSDGHPELSIEELLHYLVVAARNGRPEAVVFMAEGVALTQTDIATRFREASVGLHTQFQTESAAFNFFRAISLMNDDGTFANAGLDALKSSATKGFKPAMMIGARVLADSASSADRTVALALYMALISNSSEDPAVDDWRSREGDIRNTLDQREVESASERAAWIATVMRVSGGSPKEEAEWHVKYSNEANARFRERGLPTY